MSLAKEYLLDSIHKHLGVIKIELDTLAGRGITIIINRHECF
jgi:hypothetical protein